MRIAVYAISKNEEQFAEKFCKSAVDADVIVVGDTGSTDDTKGLLRDNGAIVYDISVKPWRFDKARDAVLALVPSYIDVCIALDLDEVLEPGWREEIERVWKVGETTRLWYKYDWSNGVVFMCDKIHARHGYTWHHPCHEYPKKDPRLTEIHARTDRLIISHHPDQTKSRGQYLDLLQMSVEEDPHCPRNTFYYARELTFYQKWDEAIKYLTKYLEMPNATWDLERGYAMRLIGVSVEGKGEDGSAWFRKACAEAPNTRDSWVDLAEVCYRRNRWAECYGAASNALSLTQPEHNYMTRPESWGYKPHDLAAIAAYRLGWKEKAIKHGQDALEFEPTDERLIKNMEYYKEL